MARALINIVENNSLANVLAAAEANKKGTIEKYEAAQKAICAQDQAAGRPGVPSEKPVRAAAASGRA